MCITRFAWKYFIKAHKSKAVNWPEKATRNRLTKQVSWDKPFINVVHNTMVYEYSTYIVYIYIYVNIYIYILYIYIYAIKI